MKYENEKAKRFFAELKGKKIAFLGIGVTNNDTIRLFLRKGLDVTVCDRRPRDQAQELCREFEEMGGKIRFGENYLDGLEEFDVLYRAPGVYFHKAELEKARERGCILTSEMETFFHLCPCKTFAITGSDGKTTTTTVIAEMLKEEGHRVYLGGNIGKALLPQIEEIQPEDFAVVELSSFQLISMRQGPDVAVITNIAPNHLDVHGNMGEYIEAKKHIFCHQSAHSRTVLNQDNEITASFAPEVRGNCWMFSRKKAVEFGAWADENGDMYVCDRRGSCKIMNQEAIRIPGLHNVENYLAAAAAVWGFVQPQTIAKVAREFGGVEHRIEFVRERKGVKWYNNSIASSPTRAIACLNTFDQKMIMLAGGYDKKIPFEPMAPKVTEKVKVLILMGVTAPKIEQAVTQYRGYDPQQLTILHAGNMEDAVQQAEKAASKGDIVVLSPACASFDMYPNFEVRGKHFKDLVNALPEGETLK